MSAKSINIYFVNVYNKSGYTERDYFAIRDIIVKSQPDYWQLLQPHSIDVYFTEKKNGKMRSEMLVSQIKLLKMNSPMFKHIGVASSVEQFIVDTNIFGKIKSLPIGNTVKVCELAIVDASN
ncbi:MAG: hypothetical protein Q8L01_03620 [Candidatus Woesebacteria bacterium]|nr:hypothetical protein [Candidatus Woesebacteria bacterium]